jgi:hypothetical protein
MMVCGLASILLPFMASCMADVSDAADHRAGTSEQELQAHDDDAAAASSTAGQTSGADPTDSKLDRGDGASTAADCGLQGPWDAGNGWWHYCIHNCNPYTINAQVFRVNGSGGQCFTITPGDTVCGFIQGNIVGIRGC